ncbi:hypothetical protein BGZ73_007708 [Actinomortierella ambigua]|nr:hypothetical protein BGZ73_007708 [Actinomortierella ambigua]
MPLVVTKISRGSTVSHRVELLRRRLHGLEEDDPDDFNHAAAWDLNVEIADLLKDEEENYEKARRHYKRALTHAEQDKTHTIDPKDRAEIEEFTEAFRYGQEHLKLAQSIDDLWEQAKARQSLGDTLLHEGESIEEEDQAMIVFKHASSQYESAKTLIAKLREAPTSEEPSLDQLQTQSLFARLNSGIIYTKLKMFSEAELDLMMALTLSKDLSDIDNERNIYMNMASLAEASGHLDKVTHHQQVELDFVRKHGLDGEVDCMLDMARVYRLRGMRDKCIETCKAIQELSDDPELSELTEEHIREMMEESEPSKQDRHPMYQSQHRFSAKENAAGSNSMEIDVDHFAASQAINATPSYQEDARRGDHVLRKRLFQKNDTAIDKLSDEISCTVHLTVDPSASIADIYRYGFQLLEPHTVTFKRIDFNNIGWLKRIVQRRMYDKHSLQLDIGQAITTASANPLLDTELLETTVKDNKTIALSVKGLESTSMPKVYKEACFKLALYPQESVISNLASIESTADFRFLASNKLTAKGLKQMLSPWPFLDSITEPKWFFSLPKPGLETLDLSFNPLGGGSGLEYIALCVDRFPSLKKLDMSRCKLSLSSTSIVLENWDKIEQLQDTLHQGLEVSIARNQFSTEGMLLWLQRASPNLTCVTSLDLSHMLRCLTLNNCDLGQTGAKGLATLLKKSVFIETLELRHARVDSKAMAELAEGIAANTSLLSLDLSGNPLGSFGASVPLTQSVEQDRSHHHPGTFYLAAAMRRHLETRTRSHLHLLILADCHLQLQDCVPLFHTHVQDLNLAHNPLLNTPEEVDELLSLVLPLTMTTDPTSAGPNANSSSGGQQAILKKLDLSWTFSSAALAGEGEGLKSAVSRKIQDLLVAWQTDSRHHHARELAPGSSVEGPIFVLVANPQPLPDESGSSMDVDP